MYNEYGYGQGPSGDTYGMLWGGGYGPSAFRGRGGFPGFGGGFGGFRGGRGGFPGFGGGFGGFGGGFGGPQMPMFNPYFGGFGGMGGFNPFFGGGGPNQLALGPGGTVGRLPYANNPFGEQFGGGSGDQGQGALGYGSSTMPPWLVRQLLGGATQQQPYSGPVGSKPMPNTGSYAAGHFSPEMKPGPGIPTGTKPPTPI